MVTIRTANLTGAALDWAVAEATGLDPIIYPSIYGTGPRVFVAQGLERVRCRPSTDWSQCGPLIQQHSVSMHCPQYEGDCWAAWLISPEGDVAQGGESALIAACRALVASMRGDSVTVPTELLAPALP